jgi:hypothetical protein
MEINRFQNDFFYLKALLEAKEKYFYEAIKNKVEFDKIKAVFENIQELKSRLSKREKERKKNKPS